MNQQNIRAVFLLLIFFFVDLVRPFGYALSANTTFLVLVCILFYNRLGFSLLLAFFAGFIQDSLIFPASLFYTFEYPLIIAAVFPFKRFFNFTKTRGHSFLPKAVLIALIILVQAFLNWLKIRSGSYRFLINFFIQSYLIFFLIDYLLRQKTGAGGSRHRINTIYDI